MAKSMWTSVYLTYWSDPCLCSSQRCPASPLSPPPPRPSSPPQQKTLHPSSPLGPPTRPTSAYHSTRRRRSTKRSLASHSTWPRPKPRRSPSANRKTNPRASANRWAAPGSRGCGLRDGRCWLTWWRDLSSRRGSNRFLYGHTHTVFYIKLTTGELQKLLLIDYWCWLIMLATVINVFNN